MRIWYLRMGPGTDESEFLWKQKKSDATFSAASIAQRAELRKLRKFSVLWSWQTFYVQRWIVKRSFFHLMWDSIVTVPFRILKAILDSLHVTSDQPDLSLKMILKFGSAGNLKVCQSFSCFPPTFSPATQLWMNFFCSWTLITVINFIHSRQIWKVHSVRATILQILYASLLKHTR